MPISSLSNKEQTENREELLQKAKELGQLAEEYALQSDEDARFPDVVIEKLKETGFNKLHRPKEFGGQYTDFHTYGDIIRTVAYYSVPAAWLTYFFIIHDTWPAFLPKEGREELYNSNESMADVFAPVGKVTNDSDGEGYRLSGQWNFCSGVYYCDWIALGAIHQMRDGTEPELSLFIVHKDDVEIINKWDPIGLRGTGSNGVKVDDVYIPPRHVFSVKRAVEGATAPDGNYDEDYQIFNVPYLIYFLAGFPQVSIGGLERLVDEYKEKTKGRIRIYNNNAKEADNSSSQAILGEFKMELTSLKTIGDQYMSQLQYYEENGIRKIEEEEREQLFAMRAHIVKTAAELGPRILSTLGGNAIYKQGHSERFVRDLIAVAAHPSNLHADAMVSYGKSILGLDGHPMW